MKLRLKPSRARRIKSGDHSVSTTASLTNAGRVVPKESSPSNSSSANQTDLSNDLAKLQTLVNVGKIEEARKVVEKIDLCTPQRDSLPQHIRSTIQSVDDEWRSVRRFLDVISNEEEKWVRIKAVNSHPYGISVQRQKIFANIGSNWNANVKTNDESSSRKWTYWYRAEATYAGVMPMDFLRLWCLLLESDLLPKWIPGQTLQSVDVVAAPSKYCRILHARLKSGWGRFEKQRDAVIQGNVYFLSHRNAYLFNMKSIQESHDCIIPIPSEGVGRLEVEAGLYVQLVSKNTYTFRLLAGEHADSITCAPYLKNLAQALECLRIAVHLCPTRTGWENKIHEKKDFYQDIMDSLRDVNKRVSAATSEGDGRKSSPSIKESDALDFHMFPKRLPAFTVIRVSLLLCMVIIFVGQFWRFSWAPNNSYHAYGAIFIYVLLEVVLSLVLRLLNMLRYEKSLSTKNPEKNEEVTFTGDEPAPSPNMFGRPLPVSKITAETKKEEGSLETSSPTKSHGNSYPQAKKKRRIHALPGLVQRVTGWHKRRKKIKAVKRKAREEKLMEERKIKLLLLGAGESGKSTVLKQMRILYGAPPSHADIEKYKIVIRSNTFVAMKKLVLIVKQLGLEHDLALESQNDSNFVNNRQSTSLQNAYDVILSCAEKGTHNWMKEDPTFENAKPIAEDFLRHFKAVEMLWQSTLIKRVWTSRSILNVIDGHKEYLRNVRRIASTDFTPTAQDILLSRLRTTEITKERFLIEGNLFEIYDVGGQRSERRKWVDIFESVDAVIFVAALSEYDQQLSESSNLNRMMESLGLFRSVCDNSDFSETPILLFLNKRDIFAEKILFSHISDQGAFADFSGQDRSYDDGIDYFKEKFIDCLIDRSQKDLFIHVTCATDTRNMQFVLSASQRIVLQDNLKQSGLLLD